MKAGYLSGYFEGVAVKYLSIVETNPKKSNQHEFNGVQALKSMFGLEKQTLNADFIYIDDESDLIEKDKVVFTWYDTRLNKPQRSFAFATEVEIGGLLLFCQESAGLKRSSQKRGRSKTLF